MTRRFLGVFILGLVALTQSNVHGGIIASGTLKVIDGSLTRLPSDSTLWPALTLGWSVARIEATDYLYGTTGINGNFTDKYLYTYEFNTNGSGNTSKELSHFTIEVSPSFTMANVLYSNPNGPSLVEDPTSPSGIDGSTGSKLFGLKWEPIDKEIFTAILISDRDPVWGDVFLKDGTVDATNSGYYAADPTSVVGVGDNPFGFLATPDTTATPPPPPGPSVVPEPASALVWLVLAGLAGSPMARRRIC